MTASVPIPRMHEAGAAGQCKIFLSSSSVVVDGQCFGSQSGLACLK